MVLFKKCSTNYARPCNALVYINSYISISKDVSKFDRSLYKTECTHPDVNLKISSYIENPPNEKRKSPKFLFIKYRKRLFDLSYYEECENNEVKLRGKIRFAGKSHTR